MERIKIEDTHDTYTTCPIILEQGAGKKEKNRYRWAFIEVAESLTKLYKDISNELKKAKIKYYLAGWHKNEPDENGKIKNPHIHILVIWEQPKAFTETFLRKIYYAHVSPHDKPNYIGMMKYIKCEDEKHKKLGIQSEIIEEIGTVGKSGCFPSLGEVKQMSREERETLGPQYKNIVKECNEADIRKQNYSDWLHKRKPFIKVIWMFGEGGSGKTQSARKLMANFDDNGVKTGSMTFDNNGNAYLDNDVDDDEIDKIEVLLINEFRDSTLKFVDFLQYLTGEKNYRRLYGWYILPNLKTIFITTRQRPEEIYKTAISENRKQIYRRIYKIMKFEGDYDYFNDCAEKVSCMDMKDYVKNNFKFDGESVNIAFF